MSNDPGLNSNWDKTEQVNGVTTIFGYDENADPTDSAIPWVFDDWFHGDERTDRPAKFSDAMVDKTPPLEEYPNETFPAWRMNSQLDIGFNTPDGKTISGWEFATDSSDMAVVTLEEEGTNPFRNLLDHYDDKEPGENYHLATVKAHSARKKLDAPINGVEGVRGSFIYGGSDPYLTKAKERADLALIIADLPTPVPSLAVDYLTHVATFYTFIDFVFMADGTKLVRMWDASPYPAHALYLGGAKVDQNVFREGIEWNTDSYLDHPAFLHFGIEANTPGLTPFDQFGSFGYRHGWDEGWGATPVGTGQQNGALLTAAEVGDALPDPLFPPDIDNPDFF